MAPLKLLAARRNWTIAELVGPVRLDEGVVAVDRVLEQVALAVEHLDILRVRELVRRAVGLVPQRQLARLDDGAERSGRVEGWDALAAGRASLRQGALRRELELDLAGQVHLLELLVLADVGGDHLADLLGLEELAEVRSRRCPRCWTRR